MRSGRAPASISRNNRSVSSLVLPDPAEAATKAENAGSEAASCARLARWRADSLIVFIRRGRPFGDARELPIVGIPGRQPGMRPRQIGAVRRIELVDQGTQFGPCLL